MLGKLLVEQKSVPAPQRTLKHLKQRFLFSYTNLVLEFTLVLIDILGSFRQFSYLLIFLPFNLLIMDILRIFKFIQCLQYHFFFLTKTSKNFNDTQPAITCSKLTIETLE